MSIVDKIKKKIQLSVNTSSNPTKHIASFWKQGGPDFEYFEKAESDNWVNTFWALDSLFYQQFKSLDTRNLLEIACGAGRHSFQCIKAVDKLYLLDSSEGALRLAKKRFSQFENVSYLLSPSGMGIPHGSISENSLSAIFSYDAMVHFEPDCVFQYLTDSYQCLSEGGLALIHHSNTKKPAETPITKSPGWRNFMTLELFKEKSESIGFEVLSQSAVAFVAANSDGLTLLRKKTN